MGQLRTVPLSAAIVQILLSVLCLGSPVALRGQTRADAELKRPEVAFLPQSWAPAAPQNTFRGFDGGVSISAVHDSSTGWYNVATPVLSYTFSPRYSVDASMSVYPYRLTQNRSANATPVTRLISDGVNMGDMLIGAHATFESGRLVNTSSTSMTLPTGNRDDGLGTGRVTINFDQRLESYYGYFSFLVGAGVGDSAGLTNRLVTEENNSLGPLAQFQAGLVFWLPQSVSVQTLAYEQLPIGDQKTYITLTRPGFPDRSVISGRRVFEDNGFTTSLCIPLTAHVTLSGSYNRSLRLHLDTVSTGFAYVWHGNPIKRKLSLIDRAMREAESGSYLPLDHAVKDLQPPGPQ